MQFCHELIIELAYLVLVIAIGQAGVHCVVVWHIVYWYIHIRTDMEKIDLDSIHFSGLERPTDGQFLKRYVDQIQKARTSLFDEMVTEIAPNHDTYQMIQKRYMMVRKNVTKEKLSEWLQTACLILDQFCLPSLQNAATIVDSLRTEKSSDQQRIIDLQNQVINKQEEQLNSVKRTVETEMKTYSAAVTKSCAAALAPKRIEAAVKKATD